ncbi:Sortase family [Arthrobacter agilis]|uniref:class F sortase n=1 Tax=Arthrobacter agilis TaxID=37921 RepID=UPI000F6D27C5|nr:class F sortase [Arthrobacter agilis]VDR33616.1 Sortase family [Arthrobacter agilis]
MTTEEPPGPDAPGGARDVPLTSVQRFAGILRRLLLPLAVVAFVAAMVVLIPGFGKSSEAAPVGGTENATPVSVLPPMRTSDSPTSTEPAPGTSVAPDGGDSAGPAAEPARSASPQGAAPTRITVPAAGIDVPVLPLAPTENELASQSIVPPLTYDGYWLTSFGSPGPTSTDTTYIAGHSWEGSEAPFDLFSTDVHPGDGVVVDTASGRLEYVVDAVVTHDKNSLKDSDIWEIVPNRLVIISCYTEDPWGKNVVVTASPAG